MVDSLDGSYIAIALTISDQGVEFHSGIGDRLDDGGYNCPDGLLNSFGAFNHNLTYLQ